MRLHGAKKNGRIAILSGAGPIGIGAVEPATGYAQVRQVVVTDLRVERLAFAAKNCSPERAKELLDSQFYTVSEVCFLSGYHNESYFSREFKKTFGIPPCEYAKTSRLLSGCFCSECQKSRKPSK